MIGHKSVINKSWKVENIMKCHKKSRNVMKSREKMILMLSFADIWQCLMMLNDVNMLYVL